jgi:hypothetical protein
MDRYCNDCRELRGYCRIQRPDGRGGTYEALIVCDHRKRRAATFDCISSGLGRAALELTSAAQAALTPADREVARVLLTHVGRARAMRAADLAAGIFDGADDPARREEVRRAVTQSIERLRIFARLPIAATKQPPYGYFLAETQDEWDEMHERYLRELVRLARLARLFRPNADLVQHLRGQLELETR